MLCSGLISQTSPKQGKTGLVILGSTGSIGQSALELCRRYPERLELLAITGGKNVRLFQDQIEEFRPRLAVLAGADFDSGFSAPARTSLMTGEDGLLEAAAFADADVVLAAIVGVACLGPVLCALSAGKRVALANKESVVCGGGMLQAALAGGKGEIIPVDSEHSSLFQCLVGRTRGEIAGVTLTASGGPFLHTPLDRLRSVTPEEAVKHPRWNMGPKISVDSATLMNKALEVIEAWWLFGVEEINVVVHPQSVVHGMASFVDGTAVCHMGVPDMKAPIAHAIFYPESRLQGVTAPLDLARIGSLEFLPLDEDRFPAVKMARECLTCGGAASAVFNIANEIAVEAFLDRKLPFIAIIHANEIFLEQFAATSVTSVEEIRMLEGRMRGEAAGILEKVRAAYA